ncbi:hypothetical protein IKQ26_07045 [bacterium]|nr:hypothetical protein [bacterium]
MAKNQLPEGVGKKIVEALKKQTEIELEQSKPAPVNALSGVASNVATDIPLRPATNPVQEETHEEETLIVEDSHDNSFMESFSQPVEVESPIAPSYDNQDITQEDLRQFDMPSNVVILRKLVNQLPPGVSKQTGAQIIRQTIEALGISMNSVLGEAQGVQDNLNVTIKECAMKIQEYKSNIAYLEKNVQEYQKQARQINDLISLFILTDNK